MRVLLTGATGSIGGAIFEGLISADCEVVCLVRSLSKSQPLVDKYGAQVSLVEFDPSQDIASQFCAAAKGFDKIIHAGFAFTEADLATEQSVIAGFLEAARETALSRPVHFIFTTGCMILGHSYSLVGESQTSHNNAFEFVRYKIALEETLLAAGSDNLHIAIVRPGWMYGGSSVDQWFRAVKKYGKILLPVQDGRVCYIHKEDLGRYYVKVLEYRATGVFVVSEGLGPTMSELIEVAKDATGVQEVERIENISEHFQTYGFFLYGLTFHQMIDAERGRLELDWAPKHNIATEAKQLIIFDE